MEINYKSTIRSSFMGYVVQAITNNFAPLLFLTFETQYGIPMEQITILITVCFIIQLFVDLASALFVDKIGYRAAALLAHGFASIGLVFLGILPNIMQNAFIGLLISVICYAIGGGLLEVIVSPMVEACPSDNKEKTMGFLHSAYCWGCVALIGLSTLFFNVVGIKYWWILSIIWAIVPLVN